jgi:sortase A
MSVAIGAQRERPSTRVLRVVERLLAVIAVVALGYCGWAWLEASLYQRYENQQLEAILASAPPGGATAAAPAPRTLPPPGTAIGRIEIPRLGVSAVVRTGSDTHTLQLAVGHIPGTALPGEPGNVGLAGHRDTFFRRLRDIEPDDRIRLVTPSGRFEYRVQRTDIVSPSDVWVLAQTPAPTLTLVTCYPFTYIGSAPERFIVRAVLERPQPLARR